MGTPRAPVVLDVRCDGKRAADPRLLPGEIRADDRTLADPPLPQVGPIAALCQAGQRRSQGAAAWMRAAGQAAECLEGGFAAWREAGSRLSGPGALPPRDGRGRTVWITRARPDTAPRNPGPEAAGLLAVSLGLSRMHADDLEQPEAGMLVHDASYRRARDATGETHDGPAASTGVAP